MKYIVSLLVVVIVLLIGVFIYEKINDSNIINDLNIARENSRAGFEQLLGEYRKIEEQYFISEARASEIEQYNIRLGNSLAESRRYSTELEQQLEQGITDSLERTRALKNINNGIENSFEDSLSIIENLREYDFTE